VHLLDFAGYMAKSREQEVKQSVKMIYSPSLVVPEEAKHHQCAVSGQDTLDQG